MVARPSSVAAFAPAERPRVVVAADGTLAAIHEPARITVVEVPSCAAFAELGTDAGAVDCDVAWVGTPPRLLVLSRFETHSTAHLVDPLGPRTIAEIRLEASMRLAAAVGTHALAVGAQGAAVLATSDRQLTPYQFPSRTVPVVAGAAGAHFVVAVPGAIEEWDPVSRLPKRRLKLPRPVTITAVGGSDRVVWMTTTQEPSRIEVIPLVNRGQPKAHDLPERIAAITGHPRSDLVTCLGATSGRVWVVDLDGRAGLRLIGPVGIDRAQAVGIVLGRVAGVIAAQAEHAVTIVTLERNEPAEPVAADRAPAPVTLAETTRSTLYGEEDPPFVDERPTSVTLARPPSPPAVAAKPVTSAPAKPLAKPPLPAFSEAVSPDAQPGAEVRTEVNADVDSEVAAWRGRVESPRARTAEAFASVWADATPRWREALAEWARHGEGPMPIGLPVETIAQRFDLAPPLETIVGHMYGQRLLGADGSAPIDIARVLGGTGTAWSEALGRGELVARGVATVHGARLRLSEPVLRALDDEAPQTGELVGTPGMVPLLGPCVIVARGPIAVVAQACLASIGGGILAADPNADVLELLAEARAYGAAPMWRVDVSQLRRVPGDRPLILVTDDDAMADSLGVPRLQ